MDAQTPALRIRYSPVNQAWFAVFGDTLTGIGDGNRSVFRSVRDAEWDLRRCGLRLVRESRSSYRVERRGED